MSKFTFPKIAQQAFSSTINDIVKIALLTDPDPLAPIYPLTNGSDTTVWVVLQQYMDGSLKLLAIPSKWLQPAVHIQHVWQAVAHCPAL